MIQRSPSKWFKLTVFFQHQRSPLVQLLEDVLSYTHIPTTRLGYPNLPSYSNPTSRATASSYPSKVQRQRPSFCEPSRPPLEPLIAHSLTCSQTQTILLQFRCPAFQTSKVSVLLTALSFPPPLSSWRVKFTYGMFLCSKRVKGIRPEKTNGKGGRKVISSSLTLWFRLITQRSTEKREQENCNADDGVSSDGRLKDGQGREVYFEFCLLIYALL